MKKLLIAICLLFMVGCSSTKKEISIPIYHAFNTNIGAFFKDKEDNYFVLKDKTYDITYSYIALTFYHEKVKRPKYFTVIDGNRYEFNYISEDEITRIIPE